MKTTKNLIAGVLIIVFISLLFASVSIQYTLSQLNAARRQGVYSSAREGITMRGEKFYQGVKKIEFGIDGPNAFDGSNPHIWFITYKIFADRHADGTPLYYDTYDTGGNYFLHMKDGWVYMSEGSFPEFIGFWMKVIGINGE